MKRNELKGTQEKSFKMATKEKIGFGRHSLADRYSFFSLKIEKKNVRRYFLMSANSFNIHSFIIIILS
jgi:hypothetical protein